MQFPWEYLLAFHGNRGPDDAHCPGLLLVSEGSITEDSKRGALSAVIGGYLRGRSTPFSELSLTRTDHCDRGSGKGNAPRLSNDATVLTNLTDYLCIVSVGYHSLSNSRHYRERTGYYLGAHQRMEHPCCMRTRTAEPGLVVRQPNRVSMCSPRCMI